MTSQSSDTSKKAVPSSSLDPTEMHPDVLGDWDLWARIIATTTLPRLEAARERMPEVSSVLLSTADGLHLCSVGVEADDAGRLAALGSSLFGVANAQSGILTNHGADPARTIATVSSGDTQIAMVSLMLDPLGHLLLALCAEGVQLGSLMVQARNTATDVRGWLDASLREQ